MLLLINALSTWTMIGLIWTIQVVHYPLFAVIDHSQFGDYHAQHLTRITWIVAPVMLGEAITTILLLRNNLNRPECHVHICLTLGLALAWLSTWLVQVPLHHQLTTHDPNVINRLITTNWIRTAAWTARGCLLFWILHNMLFIHKKYRHEIDNRECMIS